ncbi:hypothetical protein FRC03_005342, partial [Tulasnella sp. 419]
ESNDAGIIRFHNTCPVSWFPIVTRSVEQDEDHSDLPADLPLEVVQDPLFPSVSV